VGNMSNPSINRWGVNLFWYRLWYTDKNYAAILHQDKIFTELMYIFLHYGLLHPVNLFSHKMWYYNKYFKTKNYFNEHVTKYYRIMNFKNVAMGIDSNYSIRTKLKNTYVTKVWLFRYQSWVVINFYCFQPPRKKFSKKKHTRRFLKQVDFYMTRPRTPNYLIKRAKMLLLYYSLFSSTSTKGYYAF